MEKFFAIYNLDGSLFEVRMSSNGDIVDAVSKIKAEFGLFRFRQISESELTEIRLKNADVRVSFA